MGESKEIVQRGGVCGSPFHTNVNGIFSFIFPFLLFACWENLPNPLPCQVPTAEVDDVENEVEGGEIVKRKFSRSLQLQWWKVIAKCGKAMAKKILQWQVGYEQQFV